MNRAILLLALAIIVIPATYVAAASSTPVAYCEHTGYTIQINSQNKPECAFDNATKCDATDFYKRLCGQDKIKNITPRQEGQEVYSEFEKCEEGLVPSQPQFVLDQPRCHRPSIASRVLAFLRNIFG